MKELSRIQKTLKAPKGKYNSFGKYKYRSCEDILEAVKPLLNDCSLTINDTIEVFGDRFYIKATATLFDGEGNSISSTAYAREPLEKKGMDSAQVTGATSSYARKYALNGLFAIDDNEDIDSMDNSVAGKISTIEQLIKQTGADKAGLLAYFNVQSLAQLTQEQESQAIKMLNQKREK